MITPKGFLVNDHAYTITIGTGVKNTAPYGADGLNSAKTISFQTETPASVDPLMETAVWYDVNGNDAVGAGDILRLTFNTSLIGTNLDGYNDFTIAGPGSTLGTDPTGAVALSNNNKTVDITLVADSAIVAGVSTIKAANNGGNAVWTDGLGNAVNATDAVTIVKY